MVPKREYRRKEVFGMQNCGYGKFVTGMATGFMVGAAMGMAMSPSRREMKKMAHKAVDRMSEVMEAMTDAIQGN